MNDPAGLADAVASEPVAIHIPDSLGILALRAADLFSRLPLTEAMKIEHVLVRKHQKLKLKAMHSRDLFALVGFVFAMELNKSRNAKLKELAAAAESGSGRTIAVEDGNAE